MKKKILVWIERISNELRLKLQTITSKLLK
jgi:hypothetical protein